MNYKNFVVISLLISCNTDVESVFKSNPSSDKVPLSIAQNFSLIYSDSTILKSLITGEKHYDFSNDELNYSELYDNIELIIYDDNKTSNIKSDYAIIYNLHKFIEFNGNVKITTTDNELLVTDQLFYDTENNWLFTEQKFEYTDNTNKIIGNRLDSNRDFTDLITGELRGSINILD